VKDSQKYAASMEYFERESRRMLTGMLKDVQYRALCPVDMDPDVCPCGDQECAGLCEHNVWALRVLMEAITSLGEPPNETEFRKIMRDMFSDKEPPKGPKTGLKTRDSRRHG
jgi:hypothetical protein